MYEYSKLPEGLQGGMQRYLEHGILPGHFLTAVLENNLFSAVMRADSTNLSLIADIVKWIHNEAPGNSHGSEAIVIEWVDEVRKEWEESIVSLRAFPSKKELL